MMEKEQSTGTKLHLDKRSAYGFWGAAVHTVEGLPITITMYFTTRRKDCECSNHKDMRTVEKTDLNIIEWIPILKHYMKPYMCISMC